MYFCSDLQKVERVMCRALLVFALVGICQAGFAQQGTEAVKEESVELRPDRVELLIELDPKAYGLRAQTYGMQTSISADFLFLGRIMAQWEYRLSERWSLLVPVSFEHSDLSLGASLMSLVKKRPEYMAASGGVGMKLRLSEWMLRSSVFVESILQFGYQAQEFGDFGKREGVSLKPSVALGFETIFENGFLVTSKLGVQRPFDFPIGQPFFVSPGFEPFLTIGVGYAW